MRTNDPREVPVYLSLAVWGDEHVAMFLEFCLPSLLAPGNIPAICRRGGSRFLLHTRDADLATMSRSAAFQLLEQHIEVDVRLVDTNGEATHGVLTRCHGEALEAANAAGVPLIFLSPDTVWANGSMAAVDRILGSGKRVIFLPPCMRMVKEDAEPAMRALIADRGTTALSLDSRRLNEFAFGFLHPGMSEFFFERGRGKALLPMMLAWATPDGGLLAHAFHQHPLLVYPRRDLSGLSETIDGEFIAEVCPDPGDHYVVQDSDEMTAIEFVSRGVWNIEGFVPKEDSKAVARWAIDSASPVHWNLFRHPVRIHTRAIDPSAWVEPEAQAAAVVNAVLNHRRRLFIVRVWKDARYRIIERAIGVSRPEAREWMFRRRHAVSFWFRDLWQRRRIEAANRVLHPVSFFLRDLWFRRRPEMVNRVRVRLIQNTRRSMGRSPAADPQSRLGSLRAPPTCVAKPRRQVDRSTHMHRAFRRTRRSIAGR